MIDDSDERLRRARTAVGSLSAGDVGGAERIASELSDLPTLLSQSDRPGAEWAIDQIEVLAKQYPQSPRIAASFSRSLTAFIEHDSGRSAVERKLRRLRGLASAYLDNPEVAAVLAAAYANVALSRQVAVEFPALSTEAAGTVETIADKHPSDGRIAIHLALILQERAERATDPAERAAAAHRIQTLAARHPGNEYIATVRNLVNRPQQRQGGCYVATAVYGSYDCPQVMVLRRFRDRSLVKTPLGRLAIRVYYATSPSLIRVLGRRRWFTVGLRPWLDRLVARLERAGF